MDRSGDELSPWVVVAARLDDGALEALASRGLVRRARKDLEAGPPTLVEVGERLALSVGGCLVRLSTDPSRSTCTCPSQELCRHVLTAWIHLGTLAEAAPTPSALPGVLALEDEALAAWAGRSELRAALEVLAREQEAVVLLEEAPLQVRLVRQELIVRWLGEGPLETLCGCRATACCVHRLLAVLGLQVQRGGRVLPPVVARVIESQPVRDPVALRQEVSRALETLLRLGLARLGPQEARQLEGLAAAAHGVELPRLERGLRALAEELRRIDGRSGLASSARALAWCAELAALVDALKQPTPSRRGQHRARFEPLPRLELHGAGVECFATRSGFQGATVWFWAPAAGRWHSWTHARPASQPGWSAQAALVGPGPWGDVLGPVKLGEHHVTLREAWRSAEGRLSGRASTGVMVVGPSDPGAWPVLHDLCEARRAGEACFPGGLEPPTVAPIGVVAPVGWGEVGFDGVQQVWRAEARDARGQTLWLVIPWERVHQPAIAEVEQAVLASWSQVIGRWSVHEGEVVLRPFAVVVEGAVRSLGVGSAAAAAAPAGPVEEEAVELEEPVPVARGRIGELLQRVEGELVALAERGCPDRLGALVGPEERRALRQLGLESVVGVLEEAEVSVARRVLRAAWVVGVARRVVPLTPAGHAD